ncbi:MATE family efflux transporter [Delftia sp. PS-11]|uniref:MATE family efflux transporter n=1 Tax=Delftia sp. PS-11 TaxID=2767222 RepID=UPI00245904EF|nr:MATE family efflux transporter [Delftia sp. PS-11]KAJ8745416.1 MATE family efflux transporter [Delftia sp. PS-11]
MTQPADRLPQTGTPPAQEPPGSAASTPSAPLWRTFLAFLGPMVLANTLQSLSGTINSVFTGQLLGVQALAAVAAFFPVMFLFISFVIGLGAGASVLVGQAYGARMHDKLRAIAGTAMCVGLLFGAVVAVFGSLFTTPLMRLLGTPPDIMEQATLYSRIVLLGMPGLFVFLLATSLLRGVGDTVSPMLALLISTVTGLVCTPALITGWGGLPRLGVASAGVSLIIGYSLALAWLGWRLRRIGSPLAPDAQLGKAMRIDKALLKSILRVGIPTGVQMIASSMAGLVVVSLVNGFGSSATAAYGAVNQINAFAQFPVISVAITASILGAQAIGAGRSERLGAITATAIWMNLALGAALALIGSLFARPLLGLFITDAQVLTLAIELLHIVLWSGLLLGCFIALSAIMRASGDVVIPTAITIGVLAVLELPMAWALSRSFGLMGIWMALPLSYTITLCLQAAYYRLVWKKRPIRRLV